LLNAFSDEVDEDWVAFFDVAFHFHEPDVVVHYVRVERDIEL
jgi:hypothetical protein